MSDGGDEPQSSVTVVGYGKPPRDRQFKKGRSGNPRGRPKRKIFDHGGGAGDTRLSQLVMHEAYRPIEVVENGRREKLPMIQVIIRGLGVAAAKGSFKAQMAVAELVRAIENKDRSEKQLLFETVVNYKTGWQETFEQYDAAGKARPDPVPHPDDLGVNARTGEIYFNGPFDDGEKADWDRALTRKQDAEDEIKWLREECEKDPAHRPRFEDEIAHEQKILDIITLAFPDEETRRVPGFNITGWRERERRHRERRAKWRGLPQA